MKVVLRLEPLNGFGVVVDTVKVLYAGQLCTVSGQRQHRCGQLTVCPSYKRQHVLSRYTRSSDPDSGRQEAGQN